MEGERGNRWHCNLKAGLEVFMAHKSQDTHLIKEDLMSLKQNVLKVNCHECQHTRQIKPKTKYLTQTLHVAFPPPPIRQNGYTRSHNCTNTGNWVFHVKVNWHYGIRRFIMYFWQVITPTKGQNQWQELCDEEIPVTILAG